MTDADPSPAAEKPLRKQRLARGVMLAVLLGVLYLLAIEICLWRGQVALESRRHTAAIRWLHAADVMSWERAEIRFLMGRYYRRIGEFDAADKLFDLAQELGWSPRQIRREERIGMAQRGEYEVVAPYWPELFSDAGSDGPEISKAYVTGCLGMLRIADASRMLDAWEKDFPDDAEPHVLRGQLSEVLLSWADAAKSYEQALRRSPDRIDAHFGLSKALVKQSELDKADRHLRVVLKQEPEHREAQLLLVQTLIKSDRHSEAVAIVDALLEKHPRDPDVLLERGRIALGSSNPENAIAYLEQAISVRPEDRQIAYQYARALQAVGRRDEARKYFAFVDEATKPLARLNDLVERAIGDTENIALWLQIAETIGTYRSREVATTWYRSVLKMAPDCLEAHQAMFEYHRDRGDARRRDFHETRLATAKSYGESAEANDDSGESQ